MTWPNQLTVGDKLPKWTSTKECVDLCWQVVINDHMMLDKNMVLFLWFMAIYQTKLPSGKDCLYELQPC